MTIPEVIRYSARYISGLASLLVFMMTAQLSHSGTVAVIQSYSADYRWDAQYLKAIDDALGKQHTIERYELDTKKLPRSQWQSRAQQVLDRIRLLNPGVVIMGDDNALTLLGEDVVKLNIPVVFLGVNGGADQHPIIHHKKVTGILERPFFKKSIRHLRKVLSKRDRFLILMDDSPTMRNAVQEKFGNRRQASLYGSTLDILLTNQKQVWLDAMLKAGDSGYDAVIIGTHHTIRDEHGHYVPPSELMKNAWEGAQVPIFSFWDIFIGPGQAAGGFTVSAYSEGANAARLAGLILNGIPPHSLSRLQSLSGEYVYSRSGMERWGLTLSTLEASQTHFME